MTNEVDITPAISAAPSLTTLPTATAVATPTVNATTTHNRERPFSALSATKRVSAFGRPQSRMKRPQTGRERPCKTPPNQGLDGAARFKEGMLLAEADSRLCATTAHRCADHTEPANCTERFLRGVGLVPRRRVALGSSALAVASCPRTGRLRSAKCTDPVKSSAG